MSCTASLWNVALKAKDIASVVAFDFAKMLDINPRSTQANVTSGTPSVSGKMQCRSSMGLLGLISKNLGQSKASTEAMSLVFRARLHSDADHNFFKGRACLMHELNSKWVEISFVNEKKLGLKYKN